MPQGPGILSTILDRTGERLKERLEMEKEFRKTQSDSIINSLHAVDAQGNPILTPEQQEQAWGELQKMNQSQNAKQIIGKGKEIFDMIHQKIAPQHNKMFYPGSQQQNTPQPPPDEAPDAGATEGSTGGVSQAAPTMPFTPPPPGRQLLPVQKTANAAAQAPAAQSPGAIHPQASAAGGPTPPPQRTSMAQIITAGSPEAAKVRDMRAQQEAETNRQATVQRIIEQSKVDLANTKGLEDRRSKAQKMIADMRKLGTEPQFDEDMNYTGSRKIDPSEMSAQELANVAKTNSASVVADAKKTMADATAKYDAARADAINNPDSMVNRMKLFQMQLAAAHLGIAQTNSGVMQERELAQVFGVDRNGNEIPGIQHDEFGRPVGTMFSRFYGPTSATLGRVQAATPVISSAQRVMLLANDPDNADLFGPEGAIRLWAAGKIGTDDPRLTKFVPDITSLSSFVRAMHGVRSEEATKKFMDTLSNVNSPEAFKSAVEEYVKAAQSMQADVPQPYSKVGKPSEDYGPVENVILNNKSVKAQKNLKTGKYKIVP